MKPSDLKTGQLVVYRDKHGLPAQGVVWKVTRRHALLVPTPHGCRVELELVRVPAVLEVLPWVMPTHAHAWLRQARNCARLWGVGILARRALRTLDTLLRLAVLTW